MKPTEAPQAPSDANALSTRTPRARRGHGPAKPRRLRKDGTPWGKTGPAPFQPNNAQRAIVQTAVAAGIKQIEIATALGITVPTLEKYFRKELDSGNAAVVLQVFGKLFQIASGKDETADPKTVASAAQWILERRGGCGFVPPAQRTELTGKDGGPIETKQHAPRFFLPAPDPTDGDCAATGD